MSPVVDRKESIDFTLKTLLATVFNPTFTTGVALHSAGTDWGRILVKEHVTLSWRGKQQD